MGKKIASVVILGHTTHRRNGHDNRTFSVLLNGASNAQVGPQWVGNITIVGQHSHEPDPPAPPVVITPQALSYHNSVEVSLTLDSAQPPAGTQMFYRVTPQITMTHEEMCVCPWCGAWCGAYAWFLTVCGSVRYGAVRCATAVPSPCTLDRFRFQLAYGWCMATPHPLDTKTARVPVVRSRCCPTHLIYGHGPSARANTTPV